MNGHRIEKFEDVEVFLQRIANIEDSEIECTGHTLFRLSENQRKIFTCKELKNIVRFETPLKVGIQYNGKMLVIKIIMHVSPGSINIVTFYNIPISQIPR